MAAAQAHYAGFTANSYDVITTFLRVARWSCKQKTTVPSRKIMVFLRTLVLLHLSTIADGTVAPGDEDQFCQSIRTNRILSTCTLAYSANIKVLMDSRNYQNLLPQRTGAVWDLVNNDTNNPVGTITNVSMYS